MIGLKTEYSLQYKTEDGWVSMVSSYDFHEVKHAARSFSAAPNFATKPMRIIKRTEEIVHETRHN